MSISTHSETGESRAMRADAAARLLGISERHLWALHASGRLPSPVHLGRSVRWRRDELLAWLEADCPARDQWEAIRKGER